MMEHTWCSAFPRETKWQSVCVFCHGSPAALSWNREWQQQQLSWETVHCYCNISRLAMSRRAPACCAFHFCVWFGRAATELGGTSKKFCSLGSGSPPISVTFLTQVQTLKKPLTSALSVLDCHFPSCLPRDLFGQSEQFRTTRLPDASGGEQPRTCTTSRWK